MAQKWASQEKKRAKESTCITRKKGGKLLLLFLFEMAKIRKTLFRNPSNQRMMALCNVMPDTYQNSKGVGAGVPYIFSIKYIQKHVLSLITYILSIKISYEKRKSLNKSWNELIKKFGLFFKILWYWTSVTQWVFKNLSNTSTWLWIDIY